MKTKLIGLLVVVLAMSLPVFAQVALKTGGIYGKVVDDKGEPLPGVLVTLESAMNPPKTATTGPGGTFRFAALPPDTYSATFSISGFQEVRQEEVRVTVGSQVQLEIKLAPELGEQLTVLAETPLVDTKKVGVDTTFTREQLEDIPTGRDPWVIIEQTPGITTDRYNVGGTQSGQQSEFTARGASALSTVWTIDGVDYTDPFALGGTTYMDFNSFEEVEISTSGNDVAIGTSGVAVNIVTRRGGNKWQGNASYYFINDSLQSTNTPQEAIDQGLKRTDGIDQIKDYGFDLGGPVLKDKLYVWGAFQKSQVGIFKVTGQLDYTELKNKNFKANFNETLTNETYFQYTDNDKIKQGRVETPGNGSDDTLLDQGGPTNITPGLIAFGHTWTPNDKTIVTGRYAYWGLGFSLNARGGTDKPEVYLANVPYWQSTYLTQAPIDRPAHNVVIETNYFKDNWGGMDHEFRFGYNYKTARNNTEIYFGNGLYIYDTGATAPGQNPIRGYVQIIPNLISNTKYTTNSFYVADTIRRDKLTLNLGLRYDRTGGETLAAKPTVPPAFASFIPAVDWPGAKIPVTIDAFSPRIGATFDVKGDGKHIVRGNFSRYYSTGNWPSILGFTNPAGLFGYGFAYFTDNGDGVIDGSDLTSPVYLGGSLTGQIPGAPYNFDTFNQNHQYDPNLKAPYTNEITAGYETEIMKDMSIAANYTYRKYGDFEASNVPGLPSSVTPGQFGPCGNYNKTTSLGTFNVPLFCFQGTDNGQLLYTTIKDFTQDYNGLDLTVKKRMSNNLMLNGTFLYQKQKSHYDTPESLAFTYTGVHNFPFDPTAIDFLNNQPYAYRSGRSGKTGIFQFAEWQFKMGGVYQFPYDFSVGAFVRYQQGYPFVLTGKFTDTSMGASTGLTSHVFPVEPFGSRRYDNVFTMDLKIQKVFDMKAYGRVAAQLDLFNLFNTNTVLQRQNDTTATTLNQIREVFSPRAIRLGIRYSY